MSRFRYSCRLVGSAERFVARIEIDAHVALHEIHAKGKPLDALSIACIERDVECLSWGRDNGRGNDLFKSASYNSLNKYGWATLESTHTSAHAGVI